MTLAQLTETEKNKSATPSAVVKNVHHTAAADKTTMQHAENLAYTINHALACTATDFIDPFVSTQMQKYLNQKVSIGCGNPDHDHGHGENWQGIVGELAGDFGAVPLTVALQHYTPWLMDGIRYIAEPVMGDLFRRGAKSAATHQAKVATLNGTPFSPEEYRQRARELYRYEIQHLPQGLVWTASAVVGNVMIQKHILKNPSPINDIYAGKISGAIVSSSLLFGTRSLATEKAKQWDEWATKHAFLPATKTVGKWFGIKEKDVNELMEKQKRLNDPTHWRERTKSSEESAPTPAR